VLGVRYQAACSDLEKQKGKQRIRNLVDHGKDILLFKVYSHRSFVFLSALSNRIDSWLESTMRQERITRRYYSVMKILRVPDYVKAEYATIKEQNRRLQAKATPLT
jgi:hypothetical protein